MACEQKRASGELGTLPGIRDASLLRRLAGPADGAGGQEAARHRLPPSATLAVFLNQARAAWTPCLESLSWPPATAGWVTSATGCPPYVYQEYCTVPPATVKCGMRIAD
jgi:hypothetical protein